MWVCGYDLLCEFACSGFELSDYVGFPGISAWVVGVCVCGLIS